MDKQKVAAAAGWRDDEKLAAPVNETTSVPLVTEPLLLESDEWVTPEQFNKLRPLWSRPLPRIVMIGIPSAVALSMFLSLVSGNRKTASNRNQIAPNLSQAESDLSEQRILELEEEVEEYKTKNALQTQANSFKQQELETPTETASKPTPKPPQPAALKSSPPPPASVNRPPAQSRRPRPALTPAPAPAVATAPKLDPMEQWLAVANVGSYGEVSPQRSFSTDSAGYQTASATTATSDWQLSGGIGASPDEGRGRSRNRESFSAQSGTHQATNPPILLSSDPYQPVNYSTAATSLNQQLVVGTRASGKLETPIAWTGRLQNPNQIFLLKLNEPLICSNGYVVIPTDSYITARVTEATQTGRLQMEVVSVLVTENGQTREKPIPSGSILILGERGGILQASAQGKDTAGNDAAAFILSGVSQAAALINRPESQSFTNFGAYINNGEPDYLAGFVQGATQSMVQTVQQRNQQARSSIESMPTVFLLEQGTQVQIFVNRSFSF